MDGSRTKPLVIGALISVMGLALGMAGALAAEYGSHINAVRENGKIIRDYLGTHSVRKLQLGAGDVKGFTDWLNTDIEPLAGEAYLDATKPFPIPDGALSYIFSEHLIEHLSYRDGLGMLRESYRTLKPAGKVRLATPNLVKLLGLFQAPKSDEMRSYIDGKLNAPYWPELLPRTVSPQCVILNYEMRSFGHQFLYDPETLRDSLQRAGFQDIKQFVASQSDDPQLRDLEMRHKWREHAVNDYETMVFEAVRP